jgi:hypothetical protein
MTTLHMDQKKIWKKKKNSIWDTHIKFQIKPFLAYEAFRGYIHLLAKSLRCEKGYFLQCLR